MKKVSVAALLSLGLLSAGCASVSEQTQFASPQGVPCASADIATSNVKSPGLSDIFSWDATCKGDTYNCTGRTDGRMHFTEVTCKKRQ